MADDPFPNLHAMNLSFSVDEASLSPVQKLVILARMHFGEGTADISKLKMSWWKQRSKAQSIAKQTGGGEMNKVTGVELYDYKPETLAGVNFSSLYSIQLFLIAAKLVTSIKVTDQEAEAARTELIGRALALPVTRPSQSTSAPTPSAPSPPPAPLPALAVVPDDDPHRILDPPTRPLLPFYLQWPEIYAVFQQLDILPVDVLDNPKKRAGDDEMEQGTGRSKEWEGTGADCVEGSAVYGNAQARNRDENGSNWGDGESVGSSEVLPPANSIASGAVRSDQSNTTNLESRSIHIASVPSRVTKQQLVDAFTLPGFEAPDAVKITEHRLSNHSGVNTSFVHILFESNLGAENAVAKMNGRRFMGCSLIVSMAKPSKSSFPKSAYTADGYARQAGSVPSHRVQASVEEWHADSKYDVPKDIMLKFPQVIVKGMPTETTVEGFSRYVEQELSPSPKIVGIKLGPKYSDSAVVFIYCAVLATADPDSILTMRGRRIPGLTRAITVEVIEKSANTRMWAYSKMSEEFRTRVLPSNGDMDHDTMAFNVDRWIASVS